MWPFDSKIKKEAYRDGVMDVIGLIEQYKNVHKEKMRSQGFSGDEIQACITCLEAVAREGLKLIAKL
jgi:hypothetical protein